ncbi:hypothetical protein A3J77_01780 [Candidatus Wolfebacteria bacterium RBG_13_41_7]|uniref:TraC-like domain-containing protein n=1 Tax=Candidatus Wolfebacteria bacterium RBG_13_41_7 TaxID=1802554 RepID=A0A1F8DMP9_9BACT|nr:MAG: hypothetical protein A3J77_01780 [Candidatus Wolfebacteria bacterium RBG_13_41_7]
MAKEAKPTQQFVEIKDIRGDAVVLKNGSLRRVLMVSGINFELKSEEEQSVIIYAYQNFLNALDFSVQIVIRSRKMNIESYLNKLEERHSSEQNELLKNQISEYSEFIRSFIESNAVMAKNFFVIVPYDPIMIPGGGKKLLDIFGFGNKNKNSAIEESFEQKMTQLNQRTDQVVNGLAQIGLRVVALAEEELMELFYNLYNPSTVEKK